jgi:DNA modification methylase
VVIDEDNRILAGNGTVDAAKRAGISKVRVIETDGDEIIAVKRTGLTEDQKIGLALADNRTSDLSEWDKEMLHQLSEEHDITPWFEAEDLAEIMSEVEVIPPEGLTDADDVPEPPADPITKPGDLWILGNHRLLCGDSTDIHAVERLMDGQKADMVFTDPPYGIAYSSSKFDGNTKGLTNKRNKAKMIMGDEEDYNPSFIPPLFKSAKEIFIWGFQYYPHRLGRGGIIVWNKKREEEEGCPHGDFELCWSRNERNKMCWLRWGGFNNKEKGEARLHTTQKPVALAEWFFENWGKSLSLVVDLYGGSGTTLIACEKTSRYCRMMELDPAYCDVIVKRWEDFTGKKAILEESQEAY